MNTTVQSAGDWWLGTAIRFGGDVAIAICSVIKESLQGPQGIIYMS